FWRAGFPERRRQVGRSGPIERTGSRRSWGQRRSPRGDACTGASPLGELRAPTRSRCLVAAEGRAVALRAKCPSSLARDQALVRRIALERREELLDLHRGLHVDEAAAERGDGLQLRLAQEQLLLARARGGDVDRGEEALVRDRAVEDELHVARALEL